MIIITAILYFVHKGIVDVKMWTRMPSQEPIRQKYAWLIGDGIYLIGTLVMFAACFFVGRETGSIQFWEVCRQLAIGILVGSECWDLLFGYIVDQDPLYPFSDWYGGYGFKGVKFNRILFDVARVSAAVMLLLI